MHALTEYNAQWTEHNGKKVTVDGLRCRLVVRDFLAVYPYRQQMITVSAQPLSTTTKKYQAMRQQLGDDWSTDVLASDPEVTTDVMRQVGWRM